MRSLNKILILTICFLCQAEVYAQINSTEPIVNSVIDPIGGGCEIYNVSPSSFTITSDGGSAELLIEGSGCLFVVNTPAWANVLPEPGGIYNLYFEANSSSASREGYITITDGSTLLRTIPVSQEGSTEEPLIGGSIACSASLITIGQSAGVIESMGSATGGNGSYTYLWQVNYDGIWQDIPNTNSLTFQTSAFNLLSTYYFRRKVYSGSQQALSNTVSIEVVANSDGHNYIRSYNPNSAVQTEVQLADIPLANQGVDIEYFDDLGRKIQHVQVEASPQKDHIITPITYDENGRKKYDYLPYVSNSNSHLPTLKPKTIALQEQATYYNNSNNDAPIDAIPYSEKIFDNSPLNRVETMKGVGDRWHPSGVPGTDPSGHFKHTKYAFNEHDEVLQMVVNHHGHLVFNGSASDEYALAYYKASTLNKLIQTDENGHRTELFKNAEGQVVLKRAFVTEGITKVPVETYHVYDRHGLPRFILPPEATKLLKEHPDLLSLFNQLGGEQVFSTPLSGSHTISYDPSGGVKLEAGFHFKATDGNAFIIEPKSTDISDTFASMLYSYRYDNLKRLIEKKRPGVQPVYYLYDNRDRVVATQDGNQRKENKWQFTKYDVYNRPVQTGLVIRNDSRDALQQELDADYYGNKLYEVRTAQSGHIHGYTNRSWPTNVSADDFLTITYYDDYDWPGQSELHFENVNNVSGVSGYEHAYNKLTNTHVTGKKVKVLAGGDGATKWLATSLYYDNKYRVIQKVEQNYPEGISIVASKYDFKNKVESFHQSGLKPATNTPAVKLLKKYTYDHRGRALAVKQEILDDNINKEVTLAKMEYSSLGKLKRKLLHKNLGAQDFVNTLNYGYNIRGWLTGIVDEKDEYEYNISYFQQFTGNAESIEWKYKNQAQNSYHFSYDNLDRLTEANDFSSGNTGQFDVMVDEYDLQGNVKKLTRKYNGQTADHLTYNYNGNLLQSVVDDADKSKLFVDGGDGILEYAYDANGNMIKDDNRGIEQVTYNVLNLPQQLEGGGQRINYVYDASGKKLAKHGSGGTKYYFGSFVYGESDISHIMHEEGMVRIGYNSGQRTYTYLYHLKDHLGNTRIEFQANPDDSYFVTQRQSYYPFGMRFDIAQNSENDYLYNGKELQQDQIAGRSLGWYDYGARFYDPALGRFFAADPLAEKTFDWSPYRYGFCNPFRFTDPDGKSEISTIGGSGLVNDDDDDDDDVKFVTLYGGKGNREYGFAANGSSDDGDDEGDEGEKKENQKQVRKKKKPEIIINFNIWVGPGYYQKVNFLGLGTKVGGRIGGVNMVHLSWDSENGFRYIPYKTAVSNFGAGIPFLGFEGQYDHYIEKGNLGFNLGAMKLNLNDENRFVPLSYAWHGIAGGADFEVSMSSESAVAPYTNFTLDFFETTSVPIGPRR